ncbi:MAG: lytic murein transglycosylase B [Castellaniella sp.]|uniref:lytic murein transglycosylase B n=1 Tax=Castellaniella sp. TaxID=1955812 RepID=UPI002A369C0A|nr:lytic murein transglycosylase B [Castellaniella sp.]MDY0308853.1 lytic murein transglycosylase B [Castellaniella sp.]
MFRPIRILQVAVASLFISGCASSHSGSEPPAAAHEGATNQTIVSNNRINSSRTPPAPGDFLGADGRLLPEVQSFAQETARTNALPLADVETLLAQARYDAKAARLIVPPTRSGRIRRAWTSYRQRHVDAVRIREGVSFWQAHRQALDRASARTGVPPSIIVAIIGIETVYGRYTGNHRVLDVLATLGFRYPDPNRPERQAMFRQQLADLLVLDHQGMLDARSVEGSFAGAMGLPQFMPGSLMRYAVDGDGDGRVDLAGNTDDAIASVAAFLQAHGWVRDVPVFAPVALPPDAARLAQDGLKPESNWAALKAAGARALPGGGPAWQAQALGMIDLRDEIRDTHDVRCATPNFFAITHYNRSYFYAASVADLAHEIADRIGYGDPNRFDGPEN